MKPSRLLHQLIAFLFTVVVFANSSAVSANPSLRQTAGEITGDGTICNSRGECGDFSLTFDPAGGPVTGSINVNWPLTDPGSGVKFGEEVLQGTLTGYFDGEAGGVVNGTIASGQVTVTYSVTCDTCTNETQSAVGAQWEGNLNADGTGNGWIGSQDLLWNITYSAEAFQAGRGGSQQPTKTPGKAPTTTAQTAGTPASTLPGTTITATGEFCDAFNQMGFCGEISLTFNPAGGPVTGTIHGTHTVTAGENEEILTVSGTLDGTFAGGDGGQVIGTITTGVWHWTCPSCDFVLATPASLSGYVWDGNLYANGTGNGMLAVDSPWTVGFSAADFQAGLAASMQAEDTPTPNSQDYIQQQIDGISVEIGDKAWSEHELELLNDVLRQLPPSMRNNSALQHIVRYTSAWDIKTGNMDSNVMGDFSAWDQSGNQKSDCPTCARSAYTIRIFDSATNPSYFTGDATGDTDFKATILHEITHALQYYKDDKDIYQNPYTNSLLTDYIAVSETPGLRDGWDWDAKSRKWILYHVNGSELPPTNYGMTNPLEDMSESVKMYVYDPKKLLSSSPQRYTYIRDKIYGGVEYENGKEKDK